MALQWDVGYIPRKRAQTTPDHIAIVFEDRPVTYGELNVRINRCAHLLQRLDISNGDRVAVVLQNSVEFLELFFACAKLGAIFVPLNWRLVRRELAYQLQNCGARAVFFHDAFATEVGAVRDQVPAEADKFVWLADPQIDASPEAAETPSWAVSYAGLMEDEVDCEPIPRSPVGFEDPVAILYTSGTTGDPKGAVLSHEQTYFKNYQVALYMGVQPDDVMLAQLPLFHSGGLFIVATPALCGGMTVILRSDFDPVTFAQDIERYRATIVFALTTMWSFVVQSGQLDHTDVRSVRCVIGGGERTPPSLIGALAARGLHMQQGFGQTENSAMMMLPKEDIQRKRGSIGKPGFFTDVWIADAEGRRLPPGEVGELVATGPTVMSGYWNDPDATAAALRDGVLHTGDLGYVDDEGYFYVVDRAKDMYRSGGENVYPAEVEKVLTGHPGIANAAIIGVPDARWGETGMAFIVPTSADGITEDAVRAILVDQVAKFKHPKYITFVEELPLTATMKVKKTALRELARRRRPS